MIEPIKRIEHLKALSRDHHHGLLLCWKIKTGLKKNVDPDRIKKYINWFWESHLKNHFEIEEKYVFPILGNEHDLVKTALLEHGELEHLFTSTENVQFNLEQIIDKLKSHIRFEERTLFNEIQKVATPEDLEKVYEASTDQFEEDWEDEFWLK